MKKSTVLSELTVEEFTELLHKTLDAVMQIHLVELVKRVRVLEDKVSVLEARLNQ